MQTFRPSLMKMNYMIETSIIFVVHLSETEMWPQCICITTCSEHLSSKQQHPKTDVLWFSATNHKDVETRCVLTTHAQCVHQQLLPCFFETALLQSLSQQTTHADKKGFPQQLQLHVFFSSPNSFFNIYSHFAYGNKGKKIQFVSVRWQMKQNREALHLLLSSW